MLRYWRLVWLRAAKETSKSLSLTWPTFYRTVLVSAAGIGIAFLVTGRENAVTTASASFLGVILANVLVFLLLFALNCVRAPALIHADQEATIDDRDNQLGKFQYGKTNADTLRGLIAEAKFYEKKCLEKDDPAVVGQQVSLWQGKAFHFFKEELRDDGFSQLFFAATEVDHMPTELELRRHSMVQDQYFQWLCLLRAKRHVLEDCLNHLTQQAR
jgi:hypothetical protein